MIYSVTEAARVAGKSRMTILRAIATGTLSASRSEPGAPWTIEASELARVFPDADHVPNHDPNHVLPRSGDDRLPNHADDAETILLRAQLAVAELRITDKEDQIADLRRRLDQREADHRQALDRLAGAQERIAALLTDQRPPALSPARRSWWPWRR